MRCKIIKLIIPGKTYTTTSINKEQRFPAASNFNKFESPGEEYMSRVLEGM
jgi:hypothetical protein